MTEAPHRAVLMIRRLECLAAELRRAYRLTVLLQEQRRPFPMLEAISATRRGLIMAGAVHYWWHGDSPWIIGPIADVHGGPVDSRPARGGVPMRRTLGRTDLPSAPESVAEARHWLACLLGRGHLAFDDIELLTSELITNSIKYADPVGVSVIVFEIDTDRIRVEVVDGGHPANKPCLADGPLDFAEGGRGLHIVRMLAADSGVGGDATGRTVWFEVTF